MNEQRSRIQQLERRQAQDDAMLCIINRCWNRLDEDVRLFLQRFDAETAVESESESKAFHSIDISTGISLRKTAFAVQRFLRVKNRTEGK